MATLTIPNTFAPGNVITSSGHNTNNGAISSWANGNIANDNFTTMTGVVTWNVTGNVLSQSLTNVGTEGSVSIAHNGTLAPSKSALKLSSNAAQSTGDALFYINATSAASNIPALKIVDAGTASPAFQVVSTTKPSHPAPSMTTTQRNALTSVAEGDEIWNTTSKRKEVYNGTSWEDAGGRTGEIVDFAGASLPAYMLLCDGSAVSRTTYAALFAKLSTTWGVGDGSTTFNLPDLRRRTTIGSGGTAIAGPANTLASTGGHENYQSHSHGAGSYSTNSAGSHGHSISDPGHTHTESGYNTNGALGHANIGGSLGGVSTTFSATTGISINADGSHSHSITGGNSASSGSGNAENMQPCAVVHKCVVI